MLDAAGYIACTDIEDARASFHDFRVHLVRAPRLHPLNANGKKDAAAYLQHNLHAGEIVRKFLEVFGRKPLPAKGFVLHVHARYDDMAGSPPDCIILCGPADAKSEECGLGDHLHVFNWTGEGTGGYHYDALVAS